MNIKNKYKLNVAKNVAAIGFASGVLLYSCKKNDQIIEPQQTIVQPVDTSRESVVKREYQTMVNDMYNQRATAIIGIEETFNSVYNRYINKFRAANALKSTNVLKNEFIINPDDVLAAHANMQTVRHLFDSLGVPLPPPANSDELSVLYNESRMLIEKYEQLQSILNLPTQSEIDTAMRWFIEQENCNLYNHPDTIAKMDYNTGKCIKTPRDPYKKEREECASYYHTDSTAYWSNNKCIKEPRSNIKVFILDPNKFNLTPPFITIDSLLGEPTIDSVYIKVLPTFHLLTPGMTGISASNLVRGIEKLLESVYNDASKLSFTGNINPTIGDGVDEIQQISEELETNIIERIKRIPGLKYIPGYVPSDSELPADYFNETSFVPREPFQNPINVKQSGNYIAGLDKMRKDANMRFGKIKHANIGKIRNS
ncbi:MAG: hypothetical protein LBM68_06770 [Bacteroidales bacterium]|jgi:hypothetical protein|nr:hypothetical protein [Bacteroidales bacterium]